MNQLMIKQFKRRPAKLEDYYNFMHDKRGIALIFNHEKFIDPVYSKRKGTKKDGDDLKDVLKKLNFDVRYYMNLKLDEIKQILYEVSKKDHSNNDCLWVTVMSHGEKDGKILARDKDYNVQELWKNFLGEKCKSLVGKPKLFFIQACRGSMVDPGVFFELNDDVQVDSSNTVNEIPQLADLLVMYSTAEDHYSFRHPTDGSWFIQALCKELKNNLIQIDLRDDFMQVLTRVNRTVAFDKKSNTPNNIQYHSGKQMPNIVSMLTKSIFFFDKSSQSISDPLSHVDPVLSIEQSKNQLRLKETCDLYYDFMHDNRGIALIFNHEYFNDKSQRAGTKKDGHDLKAVLQELQFDVRNYKDLKLHEIKKVLYDVSLEDHSNNDCLLVSVMSHGDKDDKILAQDEEYFVQELWENFIGDNCVSLIGKPKLFFIEASRGENIDFGVPHNDEVDSIKKEFLIPKLADLLVLKSTAEGHHTFRNPSKGSWFIQALCEELKNNLKEIHLGDDFMQVLTRVNRRVAFDKIANAPNNIEYNNGKQMPNILSFLTKSFVFSKKSIIPVKSVSSDEKKKKNRSKMTDLCYDMSNANRGVALIFSNEYKNTNYGAVNSDTDDFKAVLEILQFDVRIYKNLKVDEIRNILHEVSIDDHSKNDCLLVIVMTRGKKNGQIKAEDKYYSVQELWKNFVGESCESLIGKPKLFFIDANRGIKMDSSVSIGKNNENLIDSIPHSADCLVMYSTTEGYSSFHSETDGSRFIQAICEEFKPNLQDDLFTILTRVNKKVAFAAQSNTTDNLNVGTQMAIIESTLTKLMFLFSKQSVETKRINPLIMSKDMYYDFSNVNRGVALIFNHEYFNDKPRRAGAKKDGDDLKAVLQELQFDVKYHMDLKLDEVKKVLYEVSLEDHSNNDCLLVSVMTHGEEDGKISAADKEYNVQELWKNFLGENCESLIGKPKLLFIQACRGENIDPGVPLKLNIESDEMVDLPEKVYVIPKLADLMVMYAAIENHTSYFHLSSEKSWFTEALIAELKTNLQGDFLRMLTKVNERVANKAHLKDSDFYDAKQMPIIVSMLTKELCFTSKTEE